MWKTKFLLINSIYMVFSSLEMQRRLVITKVYYKPFYSVWKRMPHKSLKVAAAKKSFSSVYIIMESLIHVIIDTTGFEECLFFLVISGRHYFSYKLIVTQRFGTTTVLLRSLKQVFWNKSAFYICYFHNNIKMLLIT